MKLIKFSHVLVLGLVLSLPAVGCKKKPVNLTKLPAAMVGTPKDSGPSQPFPGQNTPPINPNPVRQGDTPITDKPLTDKPLPPSGPQGQVNPDIRKDWPRNAEILKADTVHFDFDSSVVKASEKSKVEAVAEYLKANPNNALEIDGHCDERGTEEYNRSLGERRALALREAVAQLGIDSSRIDTVSYGKDKPADPGHDETAWRQNRRGEFLVEIAPAAP
jgi:peptidoglycan-associated lipoprotein